MFFKKNKVEDTDNQLEPEQEPLFRSPEEIYGALLKITGRGKLLRLEIEGDDQVYTTSILKVSFKSRCFVFDKLVPAQGNVFIQEGKNFKITTDFQGVLIEFVVNRKVTYREDANCFIAYFPETLLYKQRRESFRVSIPQGMRPGTTLSIPESELVINGTLTDISSSGFRAQVKGNLMEQGLSGRIVQNCVVRFPDDRLEIEVQIRHVSFNRKSQVTFLGIAFIEVRGMTQRIVDKYVSQLQFEQRRRQAPQDS